MNHTILPDVGAYDASSRLLVDSAVKGAVLLALAAVVAAILRRDSAATRHLVWLVAIVTLLVVPALSATLPRWRVLPGWAEFSADSVAEGAGRASRASTPAAAVGTASSAGNAGPTSSALGGPRDGGPMQGWRPPVAAYVPADGAPGPWPAPATPKADPPSAVRGRVWVNSLPLVWAVGSCALFLRLLAARWMLWNAERRATAVGRVGRSATAADGPLVAALEAARSQLGILRPVTLLVHPGATIPVVWGIFGPRLLLPASARQWGGEQLRSVLLHELAHVRRRDAAAQLMGQLACVLHWFNPLAWFAAWRLGVERERACDDLVLASGVRPSAYAGHLLGVVAGLSRPRWAQSCGLAMAGRSPLEGRLAAVLGKNLNRGGVSAALAAVALAAAAGVAVPVAMLRAADGADGKPAAPAAPPVQREPEKPQLGNTNVSAILTPAAEKRFQWGEAVHGLRAALVTRPSPGEPKAGDVPDLYLVVQNVSDAPVRLTDAAATGPNLHYLKLRSDGRTQVAITSADPTGTDVTLRPREVAFLPLFPSDKKNADGRTAGSLIAEGVIKDPHQTLVAEMNIDKAPAGAWTGKLLTGDTNGAAAEGKPQPKTREARALFDRWQADARADGDIPGGLGGLLADKVKEFIHNNTGDASGDPYAKKMAPLVARLDAARDWKPAEAAALMDDIAAVTPIPLEVTMEEMTEHTIQTGAPLPADLAGAPWGEARPVGLRLAWLLEPRAAEYRLGTPLKSRLLIHNAGKESVVFRTRTWHQSSEHKATDAKGAPIKIDSTYWTTLGRLMTYRLAPGAFAEVTGAGVGVGAMSDPEDWQHTRVGSWVEAKAGDDVTFAPDSVPLEDWNETPPPPGGRPAWWPDFIAARLARDLPLPAAAEERARLLDRVTRDLFGAAPTAEETAAFVADRGPGAAGALAQRLAARPGLVPFSGKLTSDVTKFHVLPADPDAAKRPRTASGPGQYTLRDSAVLAVTRRPEGERIVNEAHVAFSPPDPAKPVERHEVKLPDGYGSWAAAWVRGGTVLWVQDKTGGKPVIRTYDITNPAEVKETTLDKPTDPGQVPEPVRDALRAVPDASDQPSPATQTPK